MNKLYITIDESGTFASGEEYFVFGGYGLLGEEQFASKQRKYQSVEDAKPQVGEVKASGLGAADKQNLIDVMSGATSFAIGVRNKHLPASCYTDNLSKALVKDDLLKNIILELISSYDLALIDEIVIEIDEQNLKFGIRQNLYTSLYKELVSGYYNHNQFIKPRASHDLLLAVSYVDSTVKPLVRAADILVNVVSHKLQENQDVYSVLKIFKAL